MKKHFILVLLAIGFGFSSSGKAALPPLYDDANIIRTAVNGLGSLRDQFSRVSVINRVVSMAKRHENQKVILDLKLNNGCTYEHTIAPKEPTGPIAPGVIQWEILDVQEHC